MIDSTAKEVIIPDIVTGTWGTVNTYLDDYYEKYGVYDSMKTVFTITFSNNKDYREELITYHLDSTKNWVVFNSGFKTGTYEIISDYIITNFQITLNHYLFPQHVGEGYEVNKFSLADNRLTAIRGQLYKGNDTTLLNTDWIKKEFRTRHRGSEKKADSGFFAEATITVNFKDDGRGTERVSELRGMNVVNPFDYILTQDSISIQGALYNPWLFGNYEILDSMLIIWLESVFKFELPKR